MQKKIVTSRLSEDTYNEVKKLAEREHRSMSAQVAWILENWLSINEPLQAYFPETESNSGDLLDMWAE